MKNLFTTVFLLFVLFTANAQKTEIFAPSGKAIKGYDPVAFFKQSKPVKGADSVSFSYKGVNWFFLSNENLESFKTAPEKYIPQYGGYCAYGASNGYKAPTQTETWAIVDGKLYFNYNSKVKETWNKNQQSYIEKADKHWIEIKDKP